MVFLCGAKKAEKAARGLHDDLNKEKSCSGTKEKEEERKSGARQELSPKEPREDKRRWNGGRQKETQRDQKRREKG